MGVLSHDQILKIHEAVVSGRLVEGRAALLAGIDASFVAGLPRAASSTDQILRDLDGMNAAGTLPDGLVPLSFWLANAAALAGSRKEADVFRAALDAVRRHVTRPEPSRGGRLDKLTGKDLRDLSNALLSAFPSRSALEQLMRYRLGRIHETRTWGGSLQDTVFDLIQQAEAEDWLDELVVAALEAHPDNPALTEFARRSGLESPSTPARHVRGTNEAYLPLGIRRVPTAAAESDLLETGIALYELGRFDEALASFGACEQHAVTALDRAAATRWRGKILLQQGRRAEALDTLKSARDVLERGDAVDAAVAASHHEVLMELARLFRESGTLTTAEEQLQQAARVALVAALPTREADALDQLAEVHRLLGRNESARSSLTRSLALREVAGDDQALLATADLLGDALRDLGRPAEARARWAEARAAAKRLGDPAAEAHALRKQGVALREEGQLDASLATLDEARDALAGAGSRQTALAAVTQERAATLVARGELMLAAATLEEALDLAKGNLLLEAAVRRDIGALAIRRAMWGTARAHLEAALAIAEAANDRHGVFLALSNLGQVEAGGQRWDAAIDVHRRAQSVASQLGDRATLAIAHQSLAEALARKGPTAEAVSAYEFALALRRELGDTTGAAAVESALSALRALHGQTTSTVSKLLSDAAGFFQAADFAVEAVGTGSLRATGSTFWRNKQVAERVHVAVVAGRALDSASVLRVRDQALAANGSARQAFVVVDRAPDDAGWLLIWALRADEFTVVPVPDTLLREARTGKPGEERDALARHLARFLGRGFDPFDVRGPVSDHLSFFGRAALAGQLVEEMRNGRPVALFGLRKMGKSSLFRWLQGHLPFPTARIDLQAGVRAADVLRRAIAAWRCDAETRFGVTLDLGNVEACPSDVQEISAVISRILDRNAAQLSEPRMAVLLDEAERLVPDADASREQIDERIALMRVLRGLHDEGGRISFMIAGVDPAVGRTNRWGGEQNPFFSLLQEVWLDPLDDDDCRQMVKALGRQVGLAVEDAALDRVVRASGSHPFLARQLASLAYRSRHRQPGDLGAAEIAGAEEQFLFDPAYSFFLSELWTEVTDAARWGGDAASARERILERLAEAPEGVPVEDLAAGGDARDLKAAVHDLRTMHVLATSGGPPRVTVRARLFRGWVRSARLRLNEDG